MIKGDGSVCTVWMTSSLIAKQQLGRITISYMEGESHPTKRGREREKRKKKREGKEGGV